MTANTKRAYTAPIIDSVRIDREITLVMVTEGWGLEEAPANTSPFEKEGSSDKAAKRAASPFGGDKPDYSKM